MRRAPTPAEFGRMLGGILPPGGMDAAGMHRCLSPRAVRASAKDVSGEPIGDAALVILGKGGKPSAVMLADGVPSGDTIRVGFGGKEYLVSLEKKDGRLDGKAKQVGGTWFVELKVEGAKLIAGEVREAGADRDSWDDVMAEAELSQLAEELGELVKGILASELLGAEFMFKDGSRLTGRELFVEVEAGRGTVRRACDGKEFNAISINAGGKGAVKALLVEGCGAEGLRDLNAKFINLENYEMFTVEVAGRRYAGLIY